ncbi:MAG: hypothetical protein J07HQW2_00291 [Haloquadratum walsbyi J07HQW2]|jgi:hypothetical protein|uniref:Uncharacterized protein n=1 Tax=Haloquadratum walsbyi J07HQW2 TaxID=1238425 RepID=U1PJN3_9EURY|nr:MAG: hypothetical protein J07HQW2_00291 [Haloquadratum walsbyi J07HQW2]
MKSHGNDFSFGDIIIDKKSPDSEGRSGNHAGRAVVINTPPMTAEEWDMSSRDSVVRGVLLNHHIHYTYPELA